MLTSPRPLPIYNLQLQSQHKKYCVNTHRCLTQVISAGQSSLAALQGSTEAEQFLESTPHFAQAEKHHANGKSPAVDPAPQRVAEPPAATAG
jgi:hypothetical protein